MENIVKYWVLLEIIQYVSISFGLAHPLVDSMNQLPLMGNPRDYEQVPELEKEKSERRGNVVIGDIIIPKSSITPASGLVNKDWPDGIVPFKIHSSISNKEEQLKSVLDGIAEMNAQTCVTLRKATPYETAYIQFTAENSGCYAELAYTGREQVINLGNGCYRKGTVVHEIAHALGFYHEHSRDDRDRFVQINFDNILSGRESQFRRTGEMTKQPISYYGVSYNYESVMHYSPAAFANKANVVTIQAMNNPQAVGDPKRMGQRIGLTQTDINMINEKYGFSQKCTQ